jgi:DNA-directed RNA polymerase I subunit RPA1
VSYSSTFSFYTDEDVRKRSILEVTSSQAFDPMGHPLPGGLYDARLGSTDRAIPCVTCALPMSECPGHYAHIELAVPVYHTMLFMDIVQLLRLKCLNCHKLQAPARQLALHRAKFHLLYQHQTSRLLELDEELAQASSSASGSLLDASDAPSRSSSSNRAASGRAMDQVLRSLQPSHHADDDHDMSTVKLNSYELQLRKEFIQACISDCKRTKKCEHCGCFNPKIRQDSANKIFQVALSNQSKKRNAQENIRIVSALKSSGSGSADAAAADSDDSAHERGARDLDSDDMR